MTTERVKLLDEAAERIDGKGDEYGTPEDNFKSIASFWSEYLGIELFAHDVAQLMILLKVARLKKDPSHRDSMLDIAGYAGCLAEVSERKPTTAKKPARKATLAPGTRVRITLGSYKGKLGTITRVSEYDLTFPYAVTIDGNAAPLGYAPYEVQAVTDLTPSTMPSAQVLAKWIVPLTLDEEPKPETD